ncbi:MAG: hypothetical protein WC379_16605 [Methanoregula sp.]
MSVKLKKSPEKKSKPSLGKLPPIIAKPGGKENGTAEIIMKANTDDE